MTIFNHRIRQIFLIFPVIYFIKHIVTYAYYQHTNYDNTGNNKLTLTQFSCLIISHYSKLYKLIKPTNVHIIIDGKIITSGDYSLIEKVDNEGYKWIEKEYGVSISKEQNSKVSIGVCSVKESVGNE